MNITTLLRGALLGLTSAMLVNTGTVLADDHISVPGLSTAKSGTVACGGFYRVRGDQRVRWVFRNVNEEGDFKVDRIRIYDKTGELKYDTNDDPNIPTGGMLSDANGILGPDNNTVTPHQTVRYRSEDLPVFSGLNGPGNVQVVFEWSADKRLVPPKFTLVRMIYDRFLPDVVVARSASTCTTVK